MEPHGNVHLLEAWATHLLEREGVIINIGSLAGLTGNSRRAAYCASKLGVVNLTRWPSADYAGEDLCVNGICPSVIKTVLLNKSEAVKGSSDYIRNRPPQRQYRPDRLRFR